MIDPLLAAAEALKRAVVEPFSVLELAVCEVPFCAAVPEVFAPDAFVFGEPAEEVEPVAGAVD